MKQKTFNAPAEFGLYAKTGYCSGEFTLTVENERHKVNVILARSQMTDLIRALHGVTEKWRQELIEIDAAFKEAK